MALIATGNINYPYEVLGVVHATVSRTPTAGGCGNSGRLPIQEAYEEVTQALYDAALASGGDGVIHVGYDYRMSSANLGCNNTQPVFEVYGWGTAIRMIG
ncbi:hypothetical protein BJ123_117105 [Rhodopseudomonas thermotolerans]|uniref:Uncharacterized protein n=2 Tax=Rhodopseudomonas TaxID=1073 RepID=A0A336JV54_9BRAD|nr:MULTISPECIES: hypothetical protein [Rhodopseudomonas]RED30377.1 hypothetical protein BJ125_117105 [Rhodopseudomonas pentothenatexigens]REF92591.1 hypothetical protein BJ123_117105 [Rhodopseudomonas thermotolerans]SSW92246.1 hypothetical protein SAMN05892882_117105 [Rhodopseudomonas pentothenatexigens]